MRLIEKLKRKNSKGLIKDRTKNDLTLPQLNIPKPEFNDGRYAAKQNLKNKLLKLNNSASPRARHEKLNIKKKGQLNKNLNNEFKSKRLKGIRSKRYTENNVLTNQHSPVKRNTEGSSELNNVNTASITPAGYSPSKSTNGLSNIGGRALKSNRSNFNEYNMMQSNSSNNAYDYKNGGNRKHSSNNRANMNISTVDSVDNIKKLKSRNYNAGNIKIVGSSYKKRCYNHDDYLLNKRIEREQDPEKAFKRRNWWNMSLREDSTDEDYFKMHFKAQLIAHKALMKEKHILDHISEKEKMEQNNEIDKMLINSLKAKIKLINGL